MGDMSEQIEYFEPKREQIKHLKLRGSDILRRPQLSKVCIISFYILGKLIVKKSNHKKLMDNIIILFILETFCQTISFQLILF